MVRLARISRSTVALTWLLVAACGGDTSEPSASSSNLDPNVLPETSGNWYRPGATVTWQWQLLGAVNTSYEVEVYDIDLFDVSAATIASLQAAGRRVICYFSAGSSEDWREDFGRFQEDDMGSTLDGFSDERWLDIRSANVYAIMLARLDRAVQKGCDGVEPDNVDGFANATGFPLTSVDQLAFNRNLANEAHNRGLAVGLKNDGDQVNDLVEYYDFELNEQCHEFTECGQLQPFVAGGKPVLNVEYVNDLAAANGLATTVCAASATQGLRTLIMPLDLDDAFRVACP